MEDWEREARDDPERFLMKLRGSITRHRKRRKKDRERALHRELLTAVREGRRQDIPTIRAKYKPLPKRGTPLTRYIPAKGWLNGSMVERTFVSDIAMDDPNCNWVSVFDYEAEGLVPGQPATDLTYEEWCRSEDHAWLRIRQKHAAEGINPKLAPRMSNPYKVRKVRPEPDKNTPEGRKLLRAQRLKEAKRASAELKRYLEKVARKENKPCSRAR